MSIISALEHVNLKQPSEKSFLAHSVWLQDKVISKAISWLQSVDTRDMDADGLTKGSVPRERWQELAAGKHERKHETKRLHIKHSQHINRREMSDRMYINFSFPRYPLVQVLLQAVDHGVVVGPTNELSMSVWLLEPR